jgi:copper chaperone CopZ
MRHIELTVAGMACRRRVREVTARLRDIPGVLQVVADARSSVVRVSGSMTEADLVRALAGTTYEPTVKRDGTEVPDL